VAARRVVVGLEVGKLALKITGIPEQHMVEKFSPHRPDHAPTNGCDSGTCGTVLISSIPMKELRCAGSKNWDPNLCIPSR
jgi:hypothetical protein